ncbi:LOW QUALITY PROTEIN: Protein CBG21747, partial [Caenorhabditis briggsae]
MLFCFTTWPVAMILNQDNSLAHSVTGKRFGQCTIIFWWSCIIAHLAISINRYVSIVFPIKSYIWFTVPNTKYAIFCIWLIGFLVTIPYFWHDTCYVAFNAHTFQWTYAEDPCGQFLSLFDFIGGVILCSFAFTIDMLTLFRLREANNVIFHFFGSLIIGISTQTAAEATKRRKTEIRFFTQAFTQCIVFCICLLSFHIFTLLSDSVWWQFSMVTMIWILAHSLDGANTIIVLKSTKMMFQTFLTMISMANSIHTDEQIRKNIENEANRFQVDPFPLGLSCTVESSIQRAENYFLETCPLSYDPICDDPIFNKYQEFEYRCRFPVWSNTVLQINSSNFMDLIKMRDYYGRDWCMVVLFHSPSCPFSSRLAAHFNEIPKKFQNLISVAVDASDFTKSHRLNFRYGVSGTPTVLLWVNGIGVARMGIKDLSLESIKDLITSHTDLQEIREKNDETREDNIPERLFELGAKLEDVSVDVKENTIMNILYVLLCILVCTISESFKIEFRSFL